MKVSESNGKKVLEFDLKLEGDDRSNNERVAAMKATARDTIGAPGLRPIKRTEMAKYVKYVPDDFLDDDLYRPPTSAELKIVEKEKLEKKQAKERAKKEKAAALQQSPQKRKAVKKQPPSSKAKRSLFCK